MEAKNPFNQRKITRRKALKYMGLGAALIPASWYLGGCSGRTKMDWADIKPDTKTPVGKMTYTTLSKTGDRISLLGYGTMRFPPWSAKRRRRAELYRRGEDRRVNRLCHGSRDYYFDSAWMYHRANRKP